MRLSIEAKAYQNPVGFWLQGGSQGKVDAEGTAAGTRGLERQRALVRFRDPFRDRQPQSRAFGAARRIELDEAIEDARPIGIRDAAAAVAHANTDARAVRAHLDADGAPRRRMPHG